MILDDDVTKKSGIYPYILTGKEKYLSIRAFTDAQKLSAYEYQMGICPECGKHFDLAYMEADRILRTSPLSLSKGRILVTVNPWKRGACSSRCRGARPVSGRGQKP